VPPAHHLPPPATRLTPARHLDQHAAFTARMPGAPALARSRPRDAAAEPAPIPPRGHRPLDAPVSGPPLARAHVTAPRCPTLRGPGTSTALSTPHAQLPSQPARHALSPALTRPPPIRPVDPTPKRRGAARPRPRHSTHPRARYTDTATPQFFAYSPRPPPAPQHQTPRTPCALRPLGDVLYDATFAGLLPGTSTPADAHASARSRAVRHPHTQTCARPARVRPSPCDQCGRPALADPARQWCASARDFANNRAAVAGASR
jgi:hypothetical protein